MKKTIKIFAILILLLAVPALAGLGIAALWNSILTSACGFAAISFYQGVGLFLLGQLLSCGFLIPCFIGFGSMHALRHNREDLRGHWHSMSDRERREFIQRRREVFGFRNRPANGEATSEK